MKKPLLLFTLKCAVIVYFAACTGIDTFTTARSVTPTLTNGTWKIDLFKSEHTDNSNQFAGYSLTFNSQGNVKVSGHGIDVDGSWSEDNISKKMIIALDAGDPVLTKLNNSWNVKAISPTEVELDNTNEQQQSARLDIRSL